MVERHKTPFAHIFGDFLQRILRARRYQTKLANGFDPQTPQNETLTNQLGNKPK